MSELRDNGHGATTLTFEELATKIYAETPTPDITLEDILSPERTEALKTAKEEEEKADIAAKEALAEYNKLMAEIALLKEKDELLQLEADKNQAYIDSLQGGMPTGPISFNMAIGGMPEIDPFKGIKTTLTYVSVGVVAVLILIAILAVAI